MTKLILLGGFLRAEYRPPAIKKNQHWPLAQVSSQRIFFLSLMFNMGAHL